jgi:ribonuclease HI
MKSITIYTDGACLGNPGPGGYGVVLMYGESRKELSGGYRRTTNNRMEIMAAIRGLAALKEPCQVRLVSDSSYLVNAIEKGWARRWRTNGWRRQDKKPAENRDLWETILDLCDTHQVRFEWIRGHTGHPENERCDRLAVLAAKSPELPVDTEYENSASAAK